MQIIRDYEDIDKNRWREFVLAHPNGSVFQTPEMYVVYANSKCYKPLVIAGVDNRKNIVAILLAVIQRESYDPIGFFTSRSIIIGGPLIAGDNIEILDTVMHVYCATIKGKVIYSQIRNFSIQSLTLKDVFIRNGFLFEDHLNIILDLSVGADGLWTNVKRNRKDGINKARKQGFVFKPHSDFRDLKTFYSLLSELYRNIKLPYPDVSFFESANTHLKDNNMWFSLEYQGKPVIVLFAVTFNRVMYAHSIGISQNPDLLKLRPVDIFYWEVIRWCSENDFGVYDWMGAGKPDEEYGVRKFKLQYGGMLYNYGRYLKTHNNLLYNFGKYSLSVLQRVKK